MINPILKKEVLSSMRSRRALAMQIVYLAVLFFLAYIYWPDRGLQSMGGGEAKNLLIVFGLGQIILIAVFAPTFTSTALTAEKEKKTYESLFTTPLKPWELTFGKMAGALAFLLVLIIMGLPALASLVLLGGVSWTQITGVIGILTVTCIYLGSLGLLVSAWMSRSYRSIILTYGILLVVCVITALPVWPVSGFLIRRSGVAGSAILHLIASASPFQAMLSLVNPDGQFTAGAVGMPAFWKVYLIVASLLFAVATIVLHFVLSRPISPPRPREKLKVVERGQISARTFFFIFDPSKRKSMIRWWQNPVAIKEFRTRPMLQIHWLMRIAGICLLVSIGLMGLIIVIVNIRVAEGINLISNMLAAVAVLQILLIIALGPALSAGTICSDRETSVWDLMRSSRLKSWTIVSGKLQASVLPMLLVVISTIPALLILTFFAEGLWPSIIRCLAVICVTLLFVVMLGTFCSSLCSRTSEAAAWTYSIIAVLCLTPLVILLRDSTIDSSLIRAVFVLNPIVAVLDSAGMPGFQKYNVFDLHVRFMVILTCLFFLAAVLQVWRLCRSK